jgi:hypothetical protein
MLLIRSYTLLYAWSEAFITEAADDPEHVERLKVAGCRGRIEGLVVFNVRTFDWNCPRHVTPRHTMEEIQTPAGDAPEQHPSKHRSKVYGTARPDRPGRTACYGRYSPIRKTHIHAELGGSHEYRNKQRQAL